MTEITTDAVVLRQTDYKESDRILTVLTPERGILTVGAKGVRNIKSKNSAAVQLFSYSELELVQTGSRYTLQTATLKNGFFGLRSDLNRYSLACYAADAAAHFCTEAGDESEPFRLLLNLFYALAESKEKPLWLLKAAFELKLCTVCGFMPELGACTVCGKTTTSVDVPDEAFLTGNKYRFSLLESGLVCKDCYAASRTFSLVAPGSMPIPKDYTRPLSFAALTAARYVAISPVSRFINFRLAEEQASDFCDLAENYLLFLAERGFDTLKYYKSL